VGCMTREAFGVCVRDGPDGTRSGGGEVPFVKDERAVDGGGVIAGD
jgi:hypothetical protein